MRNYGFDQEQWGANVDVKNAGVVFWCRFLDGVGPEYACVVYEDVDLISKNFPGRCNDSLWRLDLLEVCLDNVCFAAIFQRRYIGGDLLRLFLTLWRCIDKCDLLRLSVFLRPLPDAEGIHLHLSVPVP